MKNRREDDGCCSRMFLKSIMVVFNTFFWLSGVAFLLVGMASLFWRHNFISLMDSPLFPITTYVFLGIGGLIVITGGIGCLATLREVPCCLVFYAFILMAVFLLETCVGVLAYLYESAIHEELTRNLNKTMAEKYAMDSGVTKAVDDMQIMFSCCGPTHYTDWNNSTWAQSTESNLTMVPNSCCISPKTDCGLNTHPSNIYTNGCIEDLEDFVRLHLILIGGVAIGLSILQLFGIVFSCCLSSKIKAARMV